MLWETFGITPWSKVDSGVSIESLSNSLNPLNIAIEGDGAEEIVEVSLEADGGTGGGNGGSVFAPTLRSPSVVAKRAAIGRRKTGNGSGRGGGDGSWRFVLDLVPNRKILDLDFFGVADAADAYPSSVSYPVPNDFFFFNNFVRDRRPLVGGMESVS